MILGDWGTTRLRLFRADGTGGWEKREGPGIGALDTSAAEALATALGDWAGTAPLRLTGMVGARGGLHEVAYVDCPADAPRWAAAAARLDFAGQPLTIAAGLAMPLSAVPDVMRGEETQIFGALALDPTLARGARLIVHPGTHSKWAWLEDGVVRRFRTFFTGELYALLQQSTLTRLPGGDDGEDDGFATGLARANERDLLGALFVARAAQLREGRSAGWARGYLSGLLIGHELHAAGDSAPVTLIGAPKLVAAYAHGCALQGRRHQTLDGERAVIAGLHLLEDA